MNNPSPPHPYRSDPHSSYLQKLEDVRDAAAAFLFALDTDPGFPMRRQEDLREALKRCLAPTPRTGLSTLPPHITHQAPQALSVVGSFHIQNRCPS